MNIFLVGPMGAGKSTIGRYLARELKLDFFDTDKVIEERAGADIPWIFDVEGEAGFRKREASVIEEITQKKNTVIATGGGTVELAENRQHLSARGTVVYLYADVELQMLRTTKDKNRPLLKTEDPYKVLQDLFARRHPLFEDVADITVKSGLQSPKSMVSKIMDHIDAMKVL